MDTGVALQFLKTGVLHGLHLGVSLDTVLEVLGHPRHWGKKQKGIPPSEASYFEYPFLNFFFSDGIVDCITIVLRDGIQECDPLLFGSEVSQSEFAEILLAESISFELVPEEQRRLGAWIRTDANVIVYARPSASPSLDSELNASIVLGNDCYVDTAVLSAHPQL